LLGFIPDFFFDFVFNSKNQDFFFRFSKKKKICGCLFKKGISINIAQNREAS